MEMKDLERFILNNFRVINEGTEYEENMISVNKLSDYFSNSTDPREDLLDAITPLVDAMGFTEQECRKSELCNSVNEKLFNFKTDLRKVIYDNDRV